MTSENLFKKRVNQLLVDDSVSFVEFYKYHIHALRPEAYLKRWRSIKAERIRLDQIARLHETHEQLYYWLLSWEPAALRTRAAEAKRVELIEHEQLGKEKEE